MCICEGMSDLGIGGIAEIAVQSKNIKNSKKLNKTISNMELFKPDKPIDLISQDKFQRHSFAKRIAQIALKGYNSNSLVIGIYGKWGEGKSSIMNLIKNEVQNECILIHFNPWMFNDESKLLKAFFESFANALGRCLSSRSEQAAEIFANYAEIDLKPSVTLNDIVPHLIAKLSLTKIERDIHRIEPQLTYKTPLAATTGILTDWPIITLAGTTQVRPAWKM